MTVSFTCRTFLPMPPGQAFDLSRSVDAHVGSMAKSGERAVAGVTSGLIGLGETVTWRAKHFGLPILMTSRITQFSYPDSFTDEQQRGPFRAFRHVHEFLPDDSGQDGSGQDGSGPDGGGTLMIDHVEFTAPFGVLGRLVEKAFLGRYMQYLIEERNRYLQGLA
ncbi:cyclase [Arthrobacter sp. SW1]|uniref:SRPBCC family protein n=1 Tax=Arthrobacter sp. SW1 TaxID=1920889 RepID=UPI000877C878|nr:SRPBCC family protein [Arthrobacter sp. SW1]OFI39288.1 cyclase [Arthrobacter sp. SW1]